MPLDVTYGEKALQLMTSRYNQREWRKKIEKMLSLPPSGLEDDMQRKIFMYLKLGLQAYKSRRADAPSWIVGGFATKEVIDRALFKPSVIDEAMTEKDVTKLLGVDPGEDVDTVWWDDMLVRWYINPEDDVFEELPETDEDQAKSQESDEVITSADESEEAEAVTKD